MGFFLFVIKSLISILIIEQFEVFSIVEEWFWEKAGMFNPIRRTMEPLPGGSSLYNVYEPGGIMPSAPGFALCRLRPQPADLVSADRPEQIVQGPIAMQWQG
jgi:hypothetical protein